MVHMTWHLQYQISNMLTPEQKKHVKIVPLKYGTLKVKFNEHPDCINPLLFTYIIRRSHKKESYPYKVKIKQWMGLRKIILEMIDTEIYCDDSPIPE
jgi:hypothetical protein